METSYSSYLYKSASDNTQLRVGYESRYYV
jgi:hypothetical protein